MDSEIVLFEDKDIKSEVPVSPEQYEEIFYGNTENEKRKYK